MDDNGRWDSVTTFGDAVAFLERGINYEKSRDWRYDSTYFNLDRIRELLTAIGNPHERLAVIHVAGTKGKGTTGGAAAHILTCMGHRVGLLTSPHLVTARERMRVDGEMIPEADFTCLVRTLQPYVEHHRSRQARREHKAPTYFEIMTAMAFRHFAQQSVDWAVVEVGLGGRLDSTNVVRPRCCVITAIGMEHTDKLGETPEAIATEKAGIIKPAVPVVLGSQPYAGALATLQRIADEQRCRVWQVGREVRFELGSTLAAPAGEPQAPVGQRFSLATPSQTYVDLFTPLLGAHQLGNLAAAVAAVELATGQAPPRAKLAQALAQFTIPGRLELVARAPAVLIDVAHTVESVQALLSAIAAHFPGRSLHIVFGCSEGKNLRGMLALFAGRCASFTATQSKLPRAMPAEEITAVARECEPAPPEAIRLGADPWEAFQQASSMARPEDVVCTTGSFYTAGEIRAGWEARAGRSQQ